VGVVVFNLVVVPGDGPCEGRVGRLEILVAAVLGVAVTVVRKGDDLRPAVGPDVATGGHILVRPVLVNIVSEMKDEVEVFLRRVPVSSEVAVFVLLARGEGKLHRGEGCSDNRRSLRPAHGAELRTRPEAVVLPSRRESSDFDVNRVGQLGMRERITFPDDVPERLIGGDLPLYRDPPVRHPTAVQGSGARRVQSTTPSGRGDRPRRHPA
jgi:hypothetical protein